MRIALLTDTYVPQVNGVTTVLRRIVHALERAGEEVAIVAPRYRQTPDSPPARQLRLRSWPFPPYPDIRLSVPLNSRAVGFLETFSPDVVHVATEGPIGLLGRSFAVRRGIPLVTSYHTDFPKYARHYGVPALEPAVWRWLLWFHRPAVMTHTPGSSIQAELRRRGRTQAVVWGRGVDVRRFHPGHHDPDWRRRHGFADDVAVVVHVGRLAAEKNLEVLVDAWHRARAVLGRRVAFMIAGEGPREAWLSERLPYVRRVGFLERTALATLYASTDICILPSHTETCGLVALEAMASGLAVIAADAGGFRESIRDGRTGRLVSPDDWAGFAAAIIHLVDRPERRRALGAAARQFAELRDETDEDVRLLAQYRNIVQNAHSSLEVETCPAA